MKTTNTPIAKILHMAADEHLLDGKVNGWRNFSCYAIIAAASEVTGHTCTRLSPIVKRINTGLQALGLNTESGMQFNEFRVGKQRQQARYNWLKFCALLAEEQVV